MTRWLGHLLWILLAIGAGARAAAPPIDDLEAQVTAIDPAPALWGIPSTRPTADIRLLRSALGRLDSEQAEVVAQIDHDPRLLTDPDLRQRRSDIAVMLQRLRLPIARARLTALDPRATPETIRDALESINQLAYAWGQPARDRMAAIGALRWRLGDPEGARVAWERASPDDPLVRLGRAAADAATGSLAVLPSDADGLTAAIAGAATGPSGLAGAEAIAERALTDAGHSALPLTHRTVARTLRVLGASDNSRPGLIGVFTTDTPDALAQRRDAGGLSPVAHAESLIREWALRRDERAVGLLLEAARVHPGAAARQLAAEHATPYLHLAPRTDQLDAARGFLLAWPEHPLADRWRLAIGRCAPAPEAMSALDAVRDPEIVPVAALEAARRAFAEFDAAPHDASERPELARRCAQRAAAARAAQTSPLTPEWASWLWFAQIRGERVARGPIRAAESLLTAPPADAAAAADELAPLLLSAALEAERTGADTTPAGAAGARVAALASSVRTRTLVRARCLNLAGAPGQSLGALEGAPDTPARTLARAEALLALGHDEQAFGLYRSLSGPLDLMGEHTPDETDTFWRCWSRMLGVLDAHNRDGSRTETIVREIKRLRILDAGLGGDPHRRRLEALSAKYR